jgi:hypothetical protein
MIRTYNIYKEVGYYYNMQPHQLKQRLYYIIFQQHLSPHSSILLVTLPCIEAQ